MRTLHNTCVNIHQGVQRDVKHYQSTFRIEKSDRYRDR
jgi:hypothetical protein